MKDATVQNPEQLCNLLSEIKIIPFEADERGADPIYDALSDAGDKIVPCLIAKVGDTTSMPDPRMAPRYTGIDNKVGDVALWMFVRITKVDFREFLPEQVRDDFEEEGVLAYFKYVRENEHRRDLQRRLYQWHREKASLGEDKQAAIPRKQ